jgi:hypothetical protein
MSKKPDPKPVSKTIPPAPEMEQMLGDKTPAYVEWMRDYYPQEFAIRYAGRRTHLGYHPHP